MPLDPPARASAVAPTPMRHRLALSVVGIGVVVLVFAFLLPALAGYDDVWYVISDVSIHGLVIVALLGVLNQASYPLMQMAVLPGLSYRRALAARLASTSAANTIPAGGAIGVGITYVMLSAWDFSGDRIASMVALTGVWNNIAKLTLPIAVLVIAVLQGGATADLIEAALVGTVAVVVMIGAIALLLGSPLRSAVERRADWFMLRVGRRRRSGEGAVGRFLETMAELSWSGWHRIFLATVVTNVTLFVVLLASLRAVGVRPGAVHWSEALAAFAVIRLVSAIPITPGGVGVTELGLTGMLGVGFADPVMARIAAGVLLFRFVTFIVPTPTGGLVALFWWRKRAQQRKRSSAVPAHVSPLHLEEAVCYRCGRAGERRWELDPFALVECPRCGQAFVSPRLNSAGRLALYGRPEYFDDGVYGSGPASRLQRTWAEGRLDLIEDALGDGAPHSLYEVGCAYGLFLDAARRRGLLIGGLEFSPVAAYTAAEGLGVAIDVGELTAIAEASYDAVAFWDVLEHTPNPREFIEAARDRLRPGGVLALSCPYFDSLAARLAGRRWWTLKPHKHIWHFRTRDLHRLLTDAGLTVERMVRNPLASANFARLDSLVVLARKPS